MEIGRSATSKLRFRLLLRTRTFFDALAHASGYFFSTRFEALEGNLHVPHSDNLETTDVWPGWGPKSPKPPETPDELIGTTLGNYRIRMLIGRGAVGRVYLADDLSLGRQCALKVLSPKIREHMSYQGYLAEFHNEARMAASIRDPHIVTIHKQDQDRGYHYLDMEYFPEGSLQRALDHHQRLEPIHATRIAYQIAKGLSAAHRKDVIHRDMKPDNVMMSNDGIPRIGDFGLARANSGIEGVPGVLMGTIPFMAPEMFSEIPANKSTDVYALGVTYFCMLTGELPFLGSGQTETIRAIVQTRPPNVLSFNPQIPLEMTECVYQLLDSAENRPCSGLEAASNLSALLGRIQDIDSLLTEAFGRSNPEVQWTGAGGRYTVQLTLPQNRHQTVHIENSDHLRSSEQLLSIFSTCGRVADGRNEHLYLYALRLNSQIPHGAMAIRRLNGEDFFVMVDSYPRGTVDVEEIRRSVLQVGGQADVMEQMLHKGDVH
jgi:serine/threonine protein kinase